MNAIATQRDLELELWIRTRESGKLVWKTKKGDIIPIKDMSISHLINTINMLRCNEQIRQICLENEDSI